MVSCAASPGTSAYTYHPTSPPYSGESVIVLCLDYVVNWAARYQQGDTVTAYHDREPLLANIYQLDHLWGYLPATLIHELTHAGSVMGNGILGMVSSLECLKVCYLY
jgi:hypothetical protein